MAELQAQEAVADKLSGSETAALLGSECSGPAHQFAGDHCGFGVAIGSALGQDVPDGDEQLAGDGDDGDALRLVAAEAGKLALPVRVGVDGAPGSFDQHAAEVAVRLTAVADADAETGITDQMLGGGEARDVADGSENGHGGEESQARDLDEEGHGFVPGWLIAETGELGLQVGQVLLNVIGGGNVLTDAQPFGGRDVERTPPIAVVRGEEVAAGRVDVLAMEDAVQAVLDGGALLDRARRWARRARSSRTWVGGTQTSGMRLAARSLARRKRPAAVASSSSAFQRLLSLRTHGRPGTIPTVL